MTDHLEHITIDPETFTRWEMAATAIGGPARALSTELADAKLDPTRHMLRRAAKAARFAERIAMGTARSLAGRIAGEIEAAAEGRVSPIVLVNAREDFSDDEDPRLSVRAGDVLEVDIGAEPKAGDVVAFDLGSRVGCGLRVVADAGERGELDIGVVVAVRKVRATAA